MISTYSNLEDYISQLLRQIHIYSPHQLHINNAADRLGIVLNYLPHPPACMDNFIFLDSRKSEEEQWEDFGHELCHALWHAGDQALLPISMREYQEWKAESFAQHLCIPTFMLERMEMPNSDKRAIWMIVESFGVTWEFAEKRLRQFMQNLMYR